jgi:hypothetical protein
MQAQTAQAAETDRETLKLLRVRQLAMVAYYTPKPLTADQEAANAACEAAGVGRPFPEPKAAAWHAEQAAEYQRFVDLLDRLIGDEPQAEEAA